MYNFISKLCNGLFWAFKLNIYAFFYKFYMSKNIVIYILHTEAQFMHIKSVVKRLQQNKINQYKFIFLVLPEHIEELKRHLQLDSISGVTGSIYATKFLVNLDLVLTIDQTAHLPLLGKRKKICMFHGQPSKGNSYKNFRFKEINGLFFYGPMMEEYYFEEKKNNPHWPNIATFRVGQPKSDIMFSSHKNTKATKERLGFVNLTKPIILYAPSFEYCSSLFQNGDELIQSLLRIDVNLLIKPHPSIYNKADENKTWLKKLNDYAAADNCRFYQGSDSGDVMHIIDILVTDYSGIAFDAFLLDKPVIFWDCPVFYNEYLPSKYGINGETAKNRLHTNVGRHAGIVVRNQRELLEAVNLLMNKTDYKYEKRAEVKKQLLYNRGKATEIAVDTIIKIIESRDINGLRQS